MTSNLGSEHILGNGKEGQPETEPGTLSYEQMKKLVVGILHQSFRPEFLNRIDETVVFHSLTRENIEDIAKLQLLNLADRIRDRGISIDFDEKAISFLANQGYDAHFGARPLKRTVQNLVETPLAKEIVKGDFRDGDRITVGVDNGQLAFRKK